MWIELAKVLVTCIDGGAPFLITVAFIVGTVLAHFIFR